MHPIIVNDALVRLQKYQEKKSRDREKGWRGRKYTLLYDKAVELSKNLEERMYQGYSISSVEYHDVSIAIDKVYQAATNTYAKASALMLKGIFLYTTHHASPRGVANALKEAIEYFLQALSLSVLQQYPDSYITCISQLGNVWRRAANVPLYPVDPNECRQQAYNCLNKSLKYLNGDFKYYPQELLYHLRAFNSLNLAALYRDQNRIECAYECYIIFFDNVRGGIEAFGGLRSYLCQPHAESQLREFLPVSYSFVKNFGSPEEKKKLDFTKSLAQELGISQTQLDSVDLYLDMSSPEDYLQMILYKGGEVIDDLDKIVGYVNSQMEKRISCSTDHQADLLAKNIQVAISRLARILCKKGLNETAFLSIEHHSNLRASEQFLIYWRYFNSAQEKAEFDFYMLLGTMVQILETISDYKERYAIQDDFQSLESSFSELEILNSSHVFNFEKFLCKFKKKNIDVDALYKDISKVASRPIVKSGDQYNRVTDDVLHDVVSRNSDAIFIRIDIQDKFSDILIISALFEDGELLFKNYTIPISSEVINRMAGLTGDFSDDVEWGLDFIDWQQIIPVHVSRIFLLPSYWAAFFPWVATGLPGKCLLDLVEDIVWLPGVLNLYNRFTHYHHRVEKVDIEGQDLFYSDFNSFNLNKEQLKLQINSASEFSYLGHAEQPEQQRPYMKLGDYNLLPEEMGESWRGMRLAEIWACESGSNRPNLPLASPVNEPFGMDMQMLKLGVDSAIGTLWSIPELTTRIIRKQYHKLRHSGVAPSYALLAAQKWWVFEGADQLADAYAECQLENSFLSEFLGSTPPSGDLVNELLGPMKSNHKQRPSVENPELFRKRLKHPHIWAGFRFCGVYEHKGEYVDPKAFELSEQDVVQFKQNLRSLNLNSEFFNLS